MPLSTKVPPTAVAYIVFLTLNFFTTKQRAFDEAERLAGSKGIVNIGSGCSRTALAKRICLKPGITNVDIVDGNAPVYLADLELGTLPFATKEFGCAYASHVLEHLQNWQGALDEWARIADYVIVVVPHPLSIAGYLSPDHKQFFTFRDRVFIEAQWPTVKVYM